MWARPICNLACDTFQFTRSGHSPPFHPFQQGSSAMVFRCLRCSTRPDSQASSPRSLASSADDCDWSAIYEERRAHLLWWWHRRHRVLIRGQYFFRAVLRTWLQLCSIDAEIAAAMDRCRRKKCKKRLLTNAFAAWRICQRPVWTNAFDT